MRYNREQSAAGHTLQYQAKLLSVLGFSNTWVGLLSFGRHYCVKKMGSSSDLFDCSLGMARLVSELPQLKVPRASASLSSQRVVICGGSVGGLAVAACLLRAGFTNVTVLERYKELGDGAGVGLDDASMSILLGLDSELDVVPCRWLEEVDAEQASILLSPYPYFSTRYSEVRRVLGEHAASVVRRGERVVKVSESAVVLESGEELEYDVFVAADGPRSNFRQLVQTRNLRYSGYTAWRGTVQHLSERTKASLRVGNTLFFVHHSTKKSHGVLYDINRKGLVNWLVYETRPPSAVAGKTTAQVPEEEARAFARCAREEWGEGFGGVIADTEPGDIFRTDVYDLESPMTHLCTDRIVIVGDAAHAVTPHNAKGSNMAIHDAYVLAHAASTNQDVASWLEDFSRRRVGDVSNTIYFSRHMGRLCNDGVFDSDEMVRRSLEAGVSTVALPTDRVFDPLWKFAQSNATSFYLERRNKKLSCRVNHVSRETSDVEALSAFYRDVLNLPKLERPPFDFGGAWFDVGGGVQLHIIERDPKKPSPDGVDKGRRAPEIFIRRDHHIALSVSDIEGAKQVLRDADITFAEFKVPSTSITQLFFYDPDGNGIELGNFSG